MLAYSMICQPIACLPCINSKGNQTSMPIWHHALDHPDHACHTTLLLFHRRSMAAVILKQRSQSIRGLSQSTHRYLRVSWRFTYEGCQTHTNISLMARSGSSRLCSRLVPGCCVHCASCSIISSQQLLLLLAHLAQVSRGMHTAVAPTTRHGTVFQRRN